MLPGRLGIKLLYLSYGNYRGDRQDRLIFHSPKVKK